MNIFIPWSGGADSTYLILKTLQEGHTVYSGYFELQNNEEKVKRELNAINKMLPFFKQYYKNTFIYQKSLTEIGLNGQKNIFHLCQPPIWIFSSIYSIEENIDKVYLSYIMNDDAISYLKEIEQLFNSYLAFTDKKDLKLEFPLMKTSKQEILSYLYEFEEDFLNYITFCESLEKIDNCGYCHTCMKWKFYENKGWVSHNKKRFNKDIKKENDVEMWEPVKEEIVETILDVKIID